MATGAEHDLAFNPTRSENGAPAVNVSISVYMNGTSPIPYYTNNSRQSVGPWPGNFPQSRVYFFRASSSLNATMAGVYYINVTYGGD
jgi:hypothetical protein